MNRAHEQPLSLRFGPGFVVYLGPFRFESEIEISELRASSGSGEKAVSIRLGNVPAAIPGAVLASPGCHVSSAEYLLEIPGTARYYVCNGNQVRLEFVPGTPIANVTTYLLGSCFGALCHQNGMLPLHASAVEFGGGVTAFLGDSGAGSPPWLPVFATADIASFQTTYASCRMTTISFASSPWQAG